MAPCLPADEDDDLEPAGAPAGEGSPVSKLASSALEQGQQLLGTAKDAAAPLLDSASAGLQVGGVVEWCACLVGLSACCCITAAACTAYALPPYSFEI